MESCRPLTVGLHGVRRVVMAAIHHISQTGSRSIQNVQSVAVSVDV